MALRRAKGEEEEEFATCLLLCYYFRRSWPVIGSKSCLFSHPLSLEIKVSPGPGVHFNRPLSTPWPTFQAFTRREATTPEPFLLSPSWQTLHLELFSINPHTLVNPFSGTRGTLLLPQVFSSTFPCFFRTTTLSLDSSSASPLSKLLICSETRVNIK